nr:uncharacterized protein CI109_006570 [Kwoniella shandongensis]KAA5525108.1 hypothetical protein CI109_006570 [Kwoniella shandongensis]
MPECTKSCARKGVETLEEWKGDPSKADRFFCKGWDGFKKLNEESRLDHSQVVIDLSHELLQTYAEAHPSSGRGGTSDSTATLPLSQADGTALSTMSERTTGQRSMVSSDTVQGDDGHQKDGTRGMGIGDILG